MALDLDSAVAFLEKCSEADGLPHAGADGATVKAAYKLLASEGDKDAMDKLIDWLAKDKAAAVSAAQGAGFKSTPCPITEQQFADHAPEQLKLTVFGSSVKSLKKFGEPRKSRSGGESGGRFTSGAFGYWFGGRVTINIDGEEVEFQVGGQAVAVNSAKVEKIAD
jgi:hypothetical protein